MSSSVTCITKRDRTNPHERIQAIGGAGWKHSEDDAIRWITAGTESYTVTRAGATVKVIIATRLGREYLKTERDDLSPDNLLALSRVLSREASGLHSPGDEEAACAGIKVGSLLTSAVTLLTHPRRAP